MRVQHTMNYTEFKYVCDGEFFECSGELWFKIDSDLSTVTFNAVTADGKGIGCFNPDAEVVRYPDAVVVLEGDSVP